MRPTSSSGNATPSWLLGALRHRIATFPLSALAVCLLLDAAQCDEAPSPRSVPNIVLIMADDMGFSDLGCYGSEIRTPNLDRLAAGGLRFTQFYNTARCCPTRAALLTGLNQHQAGMGHMTGNYGLPSYQGYLNRQCVTIAEALRPAGYRTMIAGKWHVGSQRGRWPRDRGFDRFYGIPEGGGHYWRMFRGRSLVLDDKVVQPEGNPWYSTDAWTDYALEFLDEAAEIGKPFFLYVAHNAPHFPLHAPPEDIARYDGNYLIGWDELRKRRHAKQVELGIVSADWPLSPRDAASPAWESIAPDRKKIMAYKMGVYAAMVDRMDQNIGRLLDRLRKLDLEENTVVMFLSDNGASAEHIDRDPPGTLPGPDGTYQTYDLPWACASNTPFKRYKMWVHEGGIATPLIVSWPGKLKGTGGLTRAVGHVTDILPTCCELAGARYPETYQGRQILPCEGRSLVPVFRGKKRSRPPIFWEHQGNRALRDGRWKLVARSGGPWELYDLEADRTELHDLAGKHPEKVEKLAAMYEAWAQRCGVVPWDKLRRGKKKPGRGGKKGGQPAKH